MLEFNCCSFVNCSGVFLLAMRWCQVCCLCTDHWTAQRWHARRKPLAQCNTLALGVQPDGWARGEREGYGEPCDVTSLTLSLGFSHKS